MANVKNITIEGARIIFRNFAGKESKYNAAGRRNFGVCIDNEDAELLAEEGWNVKYLKPREEGEEPQAYISVRVNYEVIPPAIYMVTKKRKVLMNEKTVATLDNADIENVDLVINPRFWTDNNGERKITAYLKTAYFTIQEDAFYDKYSKYDEPEQDDFIRPTVKGDDEIPFN